MGVWGAGGGRNETQNKPNIFHVPSSPSQGAAANGWKPARHAVKGTGEERGWYGAMFFTKGTVDLGEVQESVVEGKAAANGILQDGSDCGDNEIYCWQQCADVSGLPCGAEEALCATSDGVVVPFPDSRDTMTMGYQLLCASTSLDFTSVNGYDGSPSGMPTDEGGFCSGSGTDMFMDGFQFVLGGDSLCLNFLFPSFTLSSKLKFAMALFGAVGLGFLVEVLTSYRRAVFRRARERGGQARTSLTLLHGAQALIGYVLMCLAMTFSVEILLCVVFGLMLGHYFFNAEEVPRSKADPCCNEDFNYDDIADDDERQSSLHKRKSSGGAGQPLINGV